MSKGWKIKDDRILGFVTNPECTKLGRIVGFETGSGSEHWCGSDIRDPGSEKYFQYPISGIRDSKYLCNIRYPGSGIRKKFSISDIRDPGFEKFLQYSISGIRDPKKNFKIRYPGSGIRKKISRSDIRDPGSEKNFQDPISGIRDPKKISNIRYPGSGIRRNEKYSQIILNFLVENCLYYIVTMLALIPCLYGYFCDEKYSTKITSAKYLWFSNRISQMILWFWKLSIQPLTLPIEITLGEGWWLWLSGETLSPESILLHIH